MYGAELWRWDVGADKMSAYIQIALQFLPGKAAR